MKFFTSLCSLILLVFSPSAFVNAESQNPNVLYKFQPCISTDPVRVYSDLYAGLQGDYDQISQECNGEPVCYNHITQAYNDTLAHYSLNFLQNSKPKLCDSTAVIEALVEFHSRMQSVIVNSGGGDGIPLVLNFENSTTNANQCSQLFFPTTYSGIGNNYPFTAIVNNPTPDQSCLGLKAAFSAPGSFITGSIQENPGSDFYGVMIVIYNPLNQANIILTSKAPKTHKQPFDVYATLSGKIILPMSFILSFIL